MERSARFVVVKPVVRTESCRVAHVGQVVSGRITVRMNDGPQKIIEQGMSYTIPPGHDAWVEGNEPFVCVEVMSA
jgi:quercetin dioxygenase-like cupin family protein